MSFTKDINIVIKGQVSGESNTYEVVIAKLKVICAEYGLELEENPELYI